MGVKDIVVTVMLILSGIGVFIYIIGFIWYAHTIKALNWFYHDIMGWHKPDEKIGFDGASFTAKCKICGKEILQDSQGNWFEA